MDEELIDYNDFEGEHPIHASHEVGCMSTPYRIHRQLSEVDSFEPEHVELLRKEITMRKKCMKGFEAEISELEGMIEDIEDKLI